MSNNEDLKFKNINHGTIGTVYYSPNNINNIKKSAKGNQSHFIRDVPKISFGQKLVLVSIVVLGVTVGVMGLAYKGEKDEMNMNREDNYVQKLGSIMAGYSNEDIIKLTTESINIISSSKSKDPEADLKLIKDGLQRIPVLKAKGMEEEIRLLLKRFLAILSDYGIFLPGYDYNMPSFSEYAIDKVESIINSQK